MGLYGLRGIAIIGFLLLPLSTCRIYSFGVIMGLLWLSTVPLTNGIVANMFGIKILKHAQWHCVLLPIRSAHFLVGWLGGVNHDMTGNYNMIWMFLILLSVFGVLVHFFVNEEHVVHD